MVGYDEGQKQLTTTQYALAGAISGIITRLLLQPVDVIKIRLQIQVEPDTKVCCNHCLTISHTHLISKNMFV